MSVDRKFLDLFWVISGEKQNEADLATGQLCDELSSKTAEIRKNYFAYTRERLIKGLKSFAAPARAGFSKCLLQFLTRFPSDTTNEQLVQLLDKHIYDSSFSTRPEESAVKYAYISVVDILCQTGRLAQFAPEVLNKFLQPVSALTSATNWGSLALRALGLAAVQLPGKLVRKLLGPCLLETWEALNSNDTNLTGDRLLFLLRMQDKLPNFCRDNIQKLDITSKKIRRKFISGILTSFENTALDLLDIATRQSCLFSVWPSLYETSTRVPNAKHIGRFLQLVVRVVCNYGSESTATCLSKDVVDLFATQLSDKKHACFPTASKLMSEMLNAVVQHWMTATERHKGNEPMEVDQTDCRNSPASPDILFHCLISGSHFLDLSVHHSVQKPCQFLLDNVPKAIQPADMITYARQLMLLFTEPKIPPLKQLDNGKEEQITPAVPNVSAIRGFVANQLQHLLQATTGASGELFVKLTSPLLDFLVTTGLNSLFSPKPCPVGEANVISSKDAAACWVALFRFLTGLFPRSARSDGKLSTARCDLSEVLQHLLSTIREHLAPQQTVASSELPVVSEILPRLRHAIKLLTKLDSKDTLGSSMAHLYSVGCLFALSQPVEEWSQASNLLDDLRECIKRRTNPNKSSGATELPWSAVLVDVLLGLISYPSHMLRSLVRLTFEGLIISGAADPRCLNLVADVIRTRLSKDVHEAGASGKDECDIVKGEDGDEGGDNDLIIFRGDVEPYQPMIGTPGENEQSDEESVEAEDIGEDSVDEDNPMDVVDEDDEDGSDDDKDDVDSNGEEEEIDEVQLNSVRDRVRQALGPAALDEEELDSTTYQEFTDEEMFARDAALAAAFRANRKTAPDRTAAERARSLGQMKMRCLDLLECIVQHSVQPELLLPSLTVLLDIGRLAAEYEARSKQKHKTDKPPSRERASFIARYGDLPALARISDVVKLLTSRTTGTQQELCTNLTSTELLETVMQTFVTAAQLPHATPVYTKCLCSILQFLYRTAQSLELRHKQMASFSAPLLEQLELFVTCTRKSTIHGAVFAAFITQCPPFAAQAAKIIFQSLAEFVAKYPGRERGTNAEQFTAMKSMDLLFHVLKWISTAENDQINVRPLRKLPENVLTLLWSTLNPIVSDASVESLNNTVWFGSVAFANTLFTLLQWALKAAERVGRPQVVDPEMLSALRQLPSPLKPVRQAARRFVTFTEVLTSKNGSSIVDEASRAEKQRLKRELKKARQAKRREKALREQQRRDALSEKNKGANISEKSAKSIGFQSSKSKKPIKADTVPLRTNPKPKTIKSARKEGQTRRNLSKKKDDQIKRFKAH